MTHGSATGPNKSGFFYFAGMMAQLQQDNLTISWCLLTVVEKTNVPQCFNLQHGLPANTTWTDDACLLAFFPSTYAAKMNLFESLGDKLGYSEFGKFWSGYSVGCSPAPFGRALHRVWMLPWRIPELLPGPMKKRPHIFRKSSEKL